MDNIIFINVVVKSLRNPYKRVLRDSNQSPMKIAACNLKSDNNYD